MAIDGRIYLRGRTLDIPQSGLFQTGDSGIEGGGDIADVTAERQCDEGRHRASPVAADYFGESGTDIVAYQIG